MKLFATLLAGVFLLNACANHQKVSVQTDMKTKCGAKEGAMAGKCGTSGKCGK